MNRNLVMLMVILFVCSGNLFAKSVGAKPSTGDDPNTRTVDLRDEFGAIRDQGDLGFCYSYATADLLSYWLNIKSGYKGTSRDTTKEENMVSGLGYALAYNSPARKEMLGTIAISKKIKKGDKSTIEKLIKQCNASALDLEKIINSSSAECKEKYAAIKKSCAEFENYKPKKECIQFKQPGKNVNVPSDPYGIKCTDTFDCVPEEYQVVNAGSTMTAQEEKISGQKEAFFKTCSSYKLTDAIIEYRKNKYRSNSAYVSVYATTEASEPEGGDLAGEEGLVGKTELAKYGLCFEKDLPSNKGGSYREFTFHVSSDPTVEIPAQSWYSNKSILDNMYYVKTTADKKSCKQAAKSVNLMFPSIREKIIKKLLKRSIKDESFDAIKKLLGKSCYTYRSLKVALPVVKTEYASLAVDAIDEQLNKKNPVYVSYDSDIWLASKKEGFIPNHASVIVGRLYNAESKKAEYIIRNSWGKDSCERDLVRYYGEEENTLLKELYCDLEDCACMESEKEISDCRQKYINGFPDKKKKTKKPYRCDKGYYIVEKDYLALAVDSVSWLEPAPDKKKKEDVCPFQPFEPDGA